MNLPRRPFRAISLGLLTGIAAIALGSAAQTAPSDTTYLRQLTDALVTISTQAAPAQSTSEAENLARKRYDLFLKLAAKSP